MDRHVFIPFGSDWRYRHVDAPAPAGWTSEEFDDGAWDSGTAPLGYSTKESGTRIYPGASFKLRPAAAQLRRSFLIDDVRDFAQSRFAIGLHRNTSARVFLNGALVAWDGVPWPALDDDVTTGAFTGSDTSRFPLQFLIPARSLRTGRNVIAVDLRHAQRAYGALTFDLSLAAGDEAIDRSAFARSIVTTPPAAIEVGARVPDFEWLEVFTRRPRSLREFSGRPFLLQFSGAECRPCWKKLPILRRWADAGLACLSISSWGTVHDMEGPAARHQELLRGIAVGAEPNAYDAYQTACYKLFGLFNGSILIDDDGVVLAVASGFSLEEFLGEARDIDSILRSRGYVFPPLPAYVSVKGGPDDWHVVSPELSPAERALLSTAP